MRGAYQADFGRMPAGDISLGGVFSALNRAKLWIIVSTLAACAGAVVFVNVATPKYTGEAKVLIENRDNYFTRPDRDQRGAEPTIDAEAVQSQVQMIMSRDIARTVIQKLNLASLDEFDSGRKEASSLRRILALAGMAKDPLASSPEERILEAYMDKLLVYNVGKSRVISVEFSSRDPELAARGANLISDEYIQFLRDAKKSTTQGASAWLSQTLDQLRAKVAEAEGKVEVYRAQTGLLIGSSNTTIATQQLGEMNTQISNARTAQTELQAKAKMIREALKNGRIFDTSEVVNNELVRRLLEQRVAMKTQIALEERNLLPGHPRMKELTAQLADLESQIRTAAERTARTLENDARVAGAKVQSMQAEFESQKRTAADANGSEVQLRALEREARALRENYESYLTKYRDALSRDADAAAPADARVISRAVTPQKPTFPKKLPVVLLATLATLVLGCAIVVTRQVFSTDPLGDVPQPEFFEAPQPQPVEAAWTGEAPRPESAATPAPAVQPAAAQQGPKSAPAQPAPPPEEPAAPAFSLAAAAAKLDAAIRSGVRHSKRAEPAPAAPAAPAPAVPPPTATVEPEPQAVDPIVELASDLAGLKPGDGGLVVSCHVQGDETSATPTAMSLARTLSTLGSAVYIDLSGARAETEQAAGQFIPVGVTDILTGAATFGECIHRDRASRMHLIAQGASGFSPDERLMDDGFSSVIEALTQTYDYIVIDAGSLGTILDDAMEAANAIVLVTAREETDPEVMSAFERLDAVRPGCVTIVVDEPAFLSPRPANDRYASRNNAA
jgi:succinoglycan biosynthesis transport protein ExoP